MSRKHHHRKRKRHRTAPGSAPGSFMVQADASPTHIRGFRYGHDQPLADVALADIRLEDQPAGTVLWVQVVGLGDSAALQSVAQTFGIHRLTLEDIVNTHQRPKTELYGTYHFATLRFPGSGDALALTQLSLVVGDGYALTFEEGPQTHLGPVLDRLRERGGIIHSQAADYLAYAALDCCIDYFFPVVQSYSERLEAMERIVLRTASRETMQLLYAIKSELTESRRSVVPLRDLLSTLLRSDHPRFSPETRVYLRDSNDHVAQLLELIDSDRDEAVGLMDLHVSNTGNRMNEVMKLLTIISTIFIPLSFVAGLYGMNFNTSVSPMNMPELGWRWGYPAVLVLMVAMAGIMLFFFRRRGWLGSAADEDTQDRDSESTSLGRQPSAKSDEGQTGDQ